MNIIHFALVHVINNDYYDKINDEYTNELLQTIYLREGNFGIVDVINIVEQQVFTNKDSDDEQEIYHECSKALDVYINERQ